MLLIGCNSGSWRFRHTVFGAGPFHTSVRSRCYGNVLAKRSMDATHRSRIDRMWPVRGLWFESCCTVSVTCADTGTTPPACTIAISDARSITNANSHTRAHTDTDTASSIHADRSCARHRNRKSNR